MLARSIQETKRVFSYLPAAVVAAALLALSLACAQASRTASLPMAPPPDWEPLLRQADALLADGCLECLAEASEHFARVSKLSGSSRACLGQYEAEVLLDVHERVLGLPDAGHLAIADGLPCSSEFPTLAEIVRMLPRRLGRAAERAATEDQVLLLERLAQHRAEWAQFLQTYRAATLSHAIVLMRFECAYGSAGLDKVIDHSSPLYRTRAARFVRSTCNGIDGAALETLMSEQPRFREADYFLALLDLQTDTPDRAALKLGTALGWRPEWPAALFAQGSAAMSLERYPDAVTAFQRTRRLLPDDPATMLQEIIALSYAARYQDALTAATMLAGLNRWHVGDALYWKAWNEARLGDLNAAWLSVRAAQVHLSNADVAKLAGLIAARRRELQTAAYEFGLARARNPADCDSHDALSLVQLELRQWTEGAATLREVLACLQREDEELSKVATALASRGRDEAAARRRAQIGVNATTRTKGWYNSAVAAYNLGRKDEARDWASRVPAESEFGKQARELLRQLGVK